MMVPIVHLDKALGTLGENLAACFAHKVTYDCCVLSSVFLSFVIANNTVLCLKIQSVFYNNAYSELTCIKDRSLKYKFLLSSG